MNNFFAINPTFKTQLWVLLKNYTLMKLNIFNQRLQQQA